MWFCSPMQLLSACHGTLSIIICAFWSLYPAFALPDTAPGIFLQFHFMRQWIILLVTSQISCRDLWHGLISVDNLVNTDTGRWQSKNMHAFLASDYPFDLWIHTSHTNTCVIHKDVIFVSWFGFLMWTTTLNATTSNLYFFYRIRIASESMGENLPTWQWIMQTFLGEETHGPKPVHLAKFDGQPALKAVSLCA